MGELLRVDAQLGLAVSGQRIACGQLSGDLPGQARPKTLGLIDPGRLRYLCRRGLGGLAALQRQHRPLGIALAAHRHIAVTPATVLRSPQTVLAQASGISPGDLLVVTECAEKRDRDRTG